jgi:transcriptional regulator with XRE-family HTH domain
MEPKEQFAANLKQTREAKKLSQEALAAASDLHWTEVSRIERGIRSPRFDTIIALAKGLQIPPGELFEGIDPADSDQRPA